MTAEEKAKMTAIDDSLTNLYKLVDVMRKALDKALNPMVYNYAGYIGYLHPTVTQKWETLKINIIIKKYCTQKILFKIPK